ncbi:MAG: DUF4236 domain-containing protein [Bacillota bacterium]
MGLRFRKSFKVAPGIRMNVGKKGVGMSVGGKGLRMSSSSRGVSVGASIPGTGISYSKTLTNQRKKRPARQNYERLLREEERRRTQEQARLKVEQYNAHVEMLTSVHEEPSEPFDWQLEMSMDPPFQENEDGPHVKEMKKQIHDYKPTWRDKLFNRVEARKNDLSSSLEAEKKKTNNFIRIGKRLWKELLKW